jgi:hypothetical protein
MPICNLSVCQPLLESFVQRSQNASSSVPFSRWSLCIPLFDIRLPPACPWFIAVTLNQRVQKVFGGNLIQLARLENLADGSQKLDANAFVGNVAKNWRAYSHGVSAPDR